MCREGELSYRKGHECAEGENPHCPVGQSWTTSVGMLAQYPA
jgi:hypothetical protein